MAVTPGPCTAGLVPAAAHRGNGSPARPARLAEQRLGFPVMSLAAAAPSFPSSRGCRFRGLTPGPDGTFVPGVPAEESTACTLSGDGPAGVAFIAWPGEGNARRQEE
jgi:hypothetical protein